MGRSVSRVFSFFCRKRRGAVEPIASAGVYGLVISESSAKGRGKTVLIESAVNNLEFFVVERNKTLPDIFACSQRVYGIGYHEHTARAFYRRENIRLRIDMRALFEFIRYKHSGAALGKSFVKLFRRFLFALGRAVTDIYVVRLLRPAYFIGLTAYALDLVHFEHIRFAFRRRTKREHFTYVTGIFCRLTADAVANGTERAVFFDIFYAVVRKKSSPIRKYLVGIAAYYVVVAFERFVEMPMHTSAVGFVELIDELDRHLIFFRVIIFVAAIHTLKPAAFELFKYAFAGIAMQLLQITHLLSFLL